MYIPSHFDEPRIDVLHALMRAHPLATLVTLSSVGLDANHIPFHLSADVGTLGTLRGHVARANPVWRNFDRDVEALAIFHGPQAYITPSWYPTKAETGKAVPTWNYTVAHARGTLRIIDDAAWLHAHLEALTDHNEAAFPDPWRVTDAPADFVAQHMRAIVGIEIVISRLSGKCKASQNQPPQNRDGVVRGLRASGDAEAMQVAAQVESAGKAR